MTDDTWPPDGGIGYPNGGQVRLHRAGYDDKLHALRPIRCATGLRTPPVRFAVSQRRWTRPQGRVDFIGGSRRTQDSA